MKKRPLGIQLITLFIFVGNVHLLGKVINIDVLNNPIKIVYNVFELNNKFILIALILLTIILMVGYYHLSSWSYYLMIFYTIYFGCISAYLALSFDLQLFIGSLMCCLYIFLYTYRKKDLFLNRSISIH